MLPSHHSQRVAPGSAINREAFVIKQLAGGNYLKVGKMMPVLGLRVEDDSAFTRRFTGFNFDNSDNCIEYGIQANNAVHTLFITNGTNSVSNDDDKFQWGGRSEFFIDRYRVGGAIVINDGDAVSSFCGQNRIHQCPCNLIGNNP